MVARPLAHSSTNNIAPQWAVNGIDFGKPKNWHGVVPFSNGH